MKPFKIPYSLTIITPFHIGTGEELDPFTIVIKDNYLYRLNQLEFIHYLLQEKEKEFQKVMYVGNIVAIQQFFQENFNPEVKDTWFYHYLINKNIADEYIKKTSSGDNQGLIKEFIRNTALYQPYIPGSSIKGSIRTAILSSLQDSKKVKLNQEKSNDSEVQAILLDYWNSEKKVADIPSDPFKFIKFADIPFKNDWISFSKVEIKNLTADEKPKNP
ncbi:MAG: type III-A CRISPR-associated RAMP protein Csm5, partial [Candidatus Cloacimonetes bacterium]|nr:type III-A CRISPR-associated RAMP protein Csm5 [Candidatus Cloacimonadota bacterium]